jgi:hypothetical protein
MYYIPRHLTVSIRQLQTGLFESKTVCEKQWVRIDETVGTCHYLTVGTCHYLTVGTCHYLTVGTCHYLTVGTCHYLTLCLQSSASLIISRSSTAKTF